LAAAAVQLRRRTTEVRREEARQVSDALGPFLSPPVEPPPPPLPFVELLALSLGSPLPLGFNLS
jgi:hypothetical protein